MANGGTESRLAEVSDEFERASDELHSLVEQLRFSVRVSELADEFDRILAELCSAVERLRTTLSANSIGEKE